MNNKNTNAIGQIMSGVIMLVVIFLILSKFNVFEIESNKEKHYTIIEGLNTTKEIYAINENIYCNNSEFSVTNIQEKNHWQDAGVTQGKKLIAITYKIKNNTSDDKTFYSSDFEVVSENGEIKTPFMAVFTDMWNGEFMKSPTLSSGGSKEGYYTYELDENDNNYTIQYDCGSLFNEIKIKVKK